MCFSQRHIHRQTHTHTYRKERQGGKDGKRERGRGIEGKERLEKGPRNHEKGKGANNNFQIFEILFMKNL